MRRRGIGRYFTRLACGLFGLWLGACAGGEYSAPVPAGERVRTGPRAQRAPHYSEGHPYVFPRSGRLKLFQCRWETENPVGVYIDAGEEGLAWVRLALGAWEGLPLGLRFYEVLPSEAALHIYVHDDAVETSSGPGSGRAVADCQVNTETEWKAELVSARVDLALRTPPDYREEVRELSDVEFVGAAIHELGHALGYQGHSSKRRVAMTRDRFVVKQLGQRALAGEAISAPEIEKLYGEQSGRIVKDVEVDPWRTDLVDRMARLARAEGLAGPFLRVGDTAARVFWRSSAGREYGLQIPQIERVLREPTRFLVIPEAATRAALPRSNDRRPDDP